MADEKPVDSHKCKKFYTLAHNGETVVKCLECPKAYDYESWATHYTGTEYWR